MDRLAIAMELCWYRSSSSSGRQVRWPDSNDSLLSYLLLVVCAFFKYFNMMTFSDLNLSKPKHDTYSLS